VTYVCRSDTFPTATIGERARTRLPPCIKECCERMNAIACFDLA
jgi:hypothetical protein